MRCLSLLILFLSTRALCQGSPESFRAVVGDNLCYATLISTDEVLVPSHCLSAPFQSISVEGFGVRNIKLVSIYQDSHASFDSIVEKILVVKLEERLTIDNNLRPFKLVHPKLGNIDSNESDARCQIVRIEENAGVFVYNCMGSHGKSGRLLSQGGKPVGFHLGTLKSSGMSVAAFGDGPIQDLVLLYGSDLQFEKLRISCCKKLVKAVAKVGDAISDGIDSVVKVIENAKNEITRLEDDLKDLPKVFSNKYIQEKVGAIKTPKLGSLRLEGVQWTRFGNDLGGDPFRDWPSWQKDLAKRVTQAFYEFNELGKVFTLVWHEILAIKLGTPNLCQGCDDPPPRDVCASTATVTEKNQCISNLQRNIGDVNGKKRQAIDKVQSWLESEKSNVGVEL